MFYQFALPDTPDIDLFDSGDEEVNAYFRSRRWFNHEKSKHSPPTYEFRVEETGPVVGYAAVSFRNAEHPHDQSTSRAKYLMIYAVGVNKSFQGKNIKNTPNLTFAASIFSIIESLATNQAGCVGLSLWVRSNNARAIRFYQKMGFVADLNGPVPRDAGAPHLTMRKIFP